MNRKLSMILLLLGLSAMLTFVGCKEEDNNDPAPDPLIGQWLATNPATFGFQEIRIFMNQDDTARRFWRDLNNTTFDDLGTWQKVVPDSVRFSITTVNGQPETFQETNRWALANSNNDLTLTFEGLAGPVNVVFARQ